MSSNSINVGSPITKNRQFSFISLTWAGEFSSKCSQNIRTRAVYDLAISYGVASAFHDLDKNTIDLSNLGILLTTALFADIGRNAWHCMNQSAFNRWSHYNIGELVVVSRHPEIAVQCTHFSFASNLGKYSRMLWGIPIKTSPLGYYNMGNTR